MKVSLATQTPLKKTCHRSRLLQAGDSSSPSSSSASFLFHNTMTQIFQTRYLHIQHEGEILPEHHHTSTNYFLSSSVRLSGSSLTPTPAIICTRTSGMKTHLSPLLLLFFSPPTRCHFHKLWREAIFGLSEGSRRVWRRFVQPGCSVHADCCLLTTWAH